MLALLAHEDTIDETILPGAIPTVRLNETWSFSDQHGPLRPDHTLHIHCPVWRVSGSSIQSPTPQAAETPETPSESSAAAPVETPSPVPEPPAPSTPTEATSGFSELPEDLLREFDPHSFLDIPERLGYLKELGLDYGWGPTSTCQWLLESIHVYSGMPWWGSIAAVAILFRAALFYPTLVGAKHQALLQAAQAKPEFIEAKARFDEAAYHTKDRAAMLTARSDMTRVTRESGAAAWKPLVGMVMFPFSIGMFRLVRGMAGIPVPGMETGGFAWFSDLTVHDPLFILPSVGVALGVLMLKQTQRANLNPNAMQKSITKGMTYLLPPLMFLGTAWLPAGLQWFFAVLSVGSVAQTQATLTPAVRRWVGLPPLSDRNTAISKTIPTIQYQKPTTFRSGLEEGMNAATKTFKEATGSTDATAVWKRAQKYEEKRAAEEKEKTFRRMEEVRRRRAERQR
ncbi:hypothetical protein EKO27_g11679 [Xylaria grammica]|uniref:Membrane insertase YidC/Oxa/ALB C-terminal domain-containing protein n=1 Tax=Xylaria grammica TaxID=363999 RepID=A0A439CMR6_9PEZI|nr:hypothetical protein EKO27_g11679 [Xylaria grammica]